MSGDTSFIDGDFFEGLCSHHFPQVALGELRPGDLLYLRSDEIPVLFERLRNEGVRTELRILSHNGDATTRLEAGGRLVFHLGLGIQPRCQPLEVPDTVVQWFGQNLDVPNDGRFFSLPIGLERRRWSGGLKHQILAKLLEVEVAPEVLLYVNHAGNTHPDRAGLGERFAAHKWCRVSGKVPFLEYCLGMLKSRFVLSPDGNGMDCHRTWEALYLKRIPVMKRSHFHEAVYRDLPVVLVDSFEELTESFLLQKELELRSRSHDLSRLSQDYYRSLVRKAPLG